MKYGRTFNFSAGPAMMPEPVLEEIRDEMMNYRGSGMCVMEMSHRSPVFQQIIDEAEQDLRDLMGIPDNYKVLFIQGGATLQFSMIPMNLMKNGKAVYVETGAWSKKAIAEAKKVGEVIVAASSKDKNYTYVPDCSDLDIPEDTDYVYICENETIHGVTWNKLPNTKGHVLVSDQSSMFLSKPCNVSDYGMIYAGVQKNVGPAGMVVCIIREDLIRDDLTDLPIYLQYSTHAGAGSMYNTPNCWAIYCCGKVFKYLKSIGGLEEMHKRNLDKAKVFYDFLDSSKMFKGTVEPEFRSLMNVPFVTESKELDAEVVKPQRRLPATTTSRATSPSAVCARPSITPCPRRAWKRSSSSSRTSKQITVNNEPHKARQMFVAPCLKPKIPDYIINKEIISCEFLLPMEWTRPLWRSCARQVTKSLSSFMSRISWALPCGNLTRSSSAPRPRSAPTTSTRPRAAS